MSSPIRRCPLKGKAIATTSNSDNSSSLRLLGPRAITLGGMILRQTSEDLAVLNKNERSAVQFSLELEEREASGQIMVDDVMQETIPSSQPENYPDTAKDKASAEKAISLALADLLPTRWTETDFKFDEEIDPEQERLLSVKKNQRWENHFPTRSTFKSVCRLVLQTSPPAGFSFLIPADNQRPWTPPAGYACVYESWKIALGQYTANGIRILVTLTVLAAELGIKMSVRLFKELTTPSIMMKTGFFYGKVVPKYNVITGKLTKVNFWNQAYFYIKINDASFEDPSVILDGYYNANIDHLSKWSQGGSRSFLEEVEAIRTLSHQHWPDISEARIQAALNRISRNCDQRMGRLNLSSLPSYADTIGTPVRGHDSPGDSRPAKRRRSSAADQVVLSADLEFPLQSEEPSNADNQEPEVHETLLIEPLAENEVMIADETPAEEHPTDLQVEEPQGSQPQDPAQVARGDEVVEYPHLIDFKYQHTDIPFVEDHEEPARLFRQIKLKKKGMPEMEQLWQNSRYREMARAGAIFLGNANLMVRDYEAKLKAQYEKLVLKTESLKRKRKEIAKLAYKCGVFEERVGALEAEKNEAVERAELERSRNELLSKELEELKAQNEGLETQNRNLEQEKAEVELAFETTTRRLRESREHEVQKERLRVDSVLRQQVAPVYEKVHQFLEEQPTIQFKLALYSQAKGTREGLEKIQTQGLSMEEVLQQARADEAKYQEKLQGMEVVEASEIVLVPIGLDEHGSNMTAFSPQDTEDLRS
ncbi:hypothetical protein N665_0175s0005 [Sinapis alba]|nr:hypothetical protein N665_0175s0005 [Sinapis alba]